MNAQVHAIMPDMDDPNNYQGLQFFSYIISLPAGTTLAPAGSTTLTFNVDGESDFFWDKAAAYVDTGSDGTTQANQIVPGILITITDTQSTQPLQNNPQPVNSIFGTGPLPFILPIRHRFSSKATVKCQIQNITDNQTYTRVDLSFIGIKAFLRN